MEIDLKKVPIIPLQYHQKIKIPTEYYQNTDVLNIPDVDLDFSITKEDQEDILNLKAIGSFLLKDARTLEPVLYPFHVEFIEKINLDSEICGHFLKNSQNALDILDILWENIVLEIPISYTVCEDDFASVTDTGEEEIDPRLAPLRELLEKEKE